MLGKTIGGYTVSRKLAEGGMGAVYVADHHMMERQAVVKVLLPNMSSNTQMVKRFFNEAKAAAAIHHPGIVEVFDVGYLEGQAYIVMEMLRGETVTDRLKRGRLPLAKSLSIVRQLAGALGAAHEQQIIHRDLKPDNVYLVPDPEVPGGERVKILDFGIAKLAVGAGSVATRAGSIFGTPAYMAPEQCTDSAQVDQRSDLYAVGCILFEFVAGMPPFGTGGIELLASHLRDTPRDLTQLDPSVPAQVSAMVARLLAKDPNHRFQSCAELIAAIDAAGGSPSAQVPAVGAGSLPAMEKQTQLAVGTDPEDAGSAPTQAAQGNAATQAAQVSAQPPPTQALVEPAAPPAPASKTPILVGVAVVAVAAIGLIGWQLTTSKKNDEKEPAVSRADAAVRIAKPTPTDAGQERVAKPTAGPTLNRWVRITPPAKAKVLGLSASATGFGFRASRKIMTPAAAFEIQEHEVTWKELDPWLMKTGHETFPPKWIAKAADRDSLPAVGIPWKTARAYCKSINGALPTEEQWEYAARGPTLRPCPWGAAPLDRAKTRAYGGPTARVVAVKTSKQDRTRTAIYDLVGNAREWTDDVWRMSEPGQDESWTNEGGVTYRAVRGMPLQKKPPAALQRECAAYRQSFCATGCTAKASKVWKTVGFRCVR